MQGLKETNSLHALGQFLEKKTANIINSDAVQYPQYKAGILKVVHL